MSLLDLLQSPAFWLGLLCALGLVVGGLFVWSVRAAGQSRPPRYTPCLFFSADSRVVFQIKDSSSVDAWDPQTQQRVRSIPHWFLGQANTGHAVLTRSLFRGQLWVWDVLTNEKHRATPADVQLFPLPQRAIFSATGATITVRDALGQHPTFTLSVVGSQCQDLCKAATGPYLAARYDAQSAEYGHHWWHFFDLEQATEVGPRQTIDGHNFGLPHFNGLLVGAAKGGEFYYQLPTGSPLPTLPRQSPSACLHPHKPELAAVALQNRVQLFNWQTEAVLTLYPTPGPVLEVAISPNGQHLAALWQKAGDADKAVQGVSVWAL